jgi:NADPH:quinone reductase-like Zn-dependent oxidoreductase
MKAIVYEEYGPPAEVLQLREVEKPTPKADEVLIRVCASSVVYGDLALVRGSPFVARMSSGFLKPKYPIPGIDVAGIVEAVGGNVTQFQPGDEVYGDLYETGFGAYGEFVAAPADALARKPANVTFEQAAAVPQAALVALQALRDAGQIQSGQRVLVNGASGGNGTFAVQIAKSYGADVTGVCSAKNADMVRSLGADHVIDYTEEDFTQGQERYDLIFDNVAKRSASETMHVLSPHGVYLSIPFSASAMLRGMLGLGRGGQRAVQFSHKPSVPDLHLVRELIEAGKVTPVIDRTYRLAEVAEALNYYGQGHARGKVVISVSSQP